MILKRAAVFFLLLAASVVLFPMIAVLLASAGTHGLRNHLFFWPQFLLLPKGLVEFGTPGQQALLGESAIYFAVSFWLLCALACGYLMRNVRTGYVALATYPIVVSIVVVIYSLFAVFGISVYLDGP